MKQYVTEYANAADVGAPYAGPILLAESFEAAQRLAHVVKGPNNEELIVRGELMYRERPDVIGDTHTIVKRPEE